MADGLTVIDALAGELAAAADAPPVASAATARTTVGVIIQNLRI
jgi:hypothetical protein